MTGFDVAWILSGLLLVPYLVWGIYLLRLRLTKHVEFDRTVETFTVAGLVFFYLFQFDLLNTWLKGHPLAFMAAVVGFGFPGALIAALILFLGHGLNIIMSAMSIIVHGVRLNVLEFSNHLNMEWSGIAYNPFRVKNPEESENSV